LWSSLSLSLALAVWPCSPRLSLFQVRVCGDDDDEIERCYSLSLSPAPHTRPQSVNPRLYARVRFQMRVLICPIPSLERTALSRAGCLRRHGNTGLRPSKLCVWLCPLRDQTAPLPPFTRKPIINQGPRPHRSLCFHSSLLAPPSVLTVPAPRGSAAHTSKALLAQISRPALLPLLSTSLLPSPAQSPQVLEKAHQDTSPTHVMPLGSPCFNRSRFVWA
jgi:hypothetical protein